MIAVNMAGGEWGRSKQAVGNDVLHCLRAIAHFRHTAKMESKGLPPSPMPLLPYPSIFYFFCAHRNSEIPKQVPLSCEVQASQRKSADEFDNKDLIYHTGCVEVSRINYSPTTRKMNDTTKYLGINLLYFCLCAARRSNQLLLAVYVPEKYWAFRQYLRSRLTIYSTR